LTFEVTDRGIGLTENEISRVFDAFAQGDHASEPGSHRFGGLGLGLAISRTLVQMHGGSLRATSAGRGLGATFTIELPLSRSTSDGICRDGSMVPGEDSPRPNARILLVEDHLPSRLTLAKLLSRRGHTVAAAGTVAEALAISHANAFDVVVSDIGLPDGSGYTLMQELRQKFNLKGIALSGYGAENDIKKSEAVGFLSHLTKPVNVQQLDETLKQILSRHVS
jgi:CheY-like chemotaxis protein